MDYRVFLVAVGVVVATLAGVASSEAAGAAGAGAGAVDDVSDIKRGDVSQAFEVRLFDLTSVRRSFLTLARLRPAMTEGERVAAWADFTLMAQSIAGESSTSFLAFDDLAASLANGPGPRVLATRGVARRDGVGYLMLVVGYSARETADVVSGRIGRGALDTAQKMLAVGLGHAAAADYLDAQYARVDAWREEQRAAALAAAAPVYFGGPFDELIERYANLHAVESALVRAIIQTESAFNPAARSHAGAIGLMQLMPGTAQELGVNPFVPEQNIEGGVRYFAQLLRKFGAVDLALVAYNAGPGFAERYIRGQAALYGETREYVRNVLARFTAQR